MKLAEHVEQIRQLIDNAFRNRLGRMGITSSALKSMESISVEHLQDRKRIEVIRETLIAETGSIGDAYEKLIEEFTFTLFNRLAALKVMEAHTLHPEIITRRSQHGDRSFAHVLWLEQNPAGRREEMEGLVPFLADQLMVLAGDIPLFSPHHPYHLLPSAIELNSIINAVNQLEIDTQVDSEIWKSDDVLGWLYESYNNYKKKAHKDSGAKTEYNKVSIQSQVYTPRWVVKFLVDNSLGKLYLEMFPDSTIKDRYKIANIPQIQTRERKLLTELRLIDPATGSGNFLLYGFDFFYDLYTDQIENYGADYDERKIPELIIHNNLYGIDLDDRAIQLAQLALYIKAKQKKRSAKIEQFNIVSSDFFLPDYQIVKHLFENGEKLSTELEEIVTELWADLQQAYKFGSLIMLEEKFTNRLQKLESKFERPQISIFEYSEMETYYNFRQSFFESLKKALAHNTEEQGLTFLNTKTTDAITFLQILTQKYDVAVANPPYTDSSDFGPDLKKFVDANYKQPYKFNANLYATFIKRCYELVDKKGKIALIHPLTFMYIKSFEDVRKFIIDKMHVNVFVDYGLSNLFGAVMVDPAFYVLEKEKTVDNAWFISLDQYTRTPQEKNKKDYCLGALGDYVETRHNKHNYIIDQKKLEIIEGWPFIYWISDGFREKFKQTKIGKYLKAKKGLGTENIRFFRFWWEVDRNDISEDYVTDQKKWVGYVKGGPYKKWYGNLWLLLNWENDGQKIKSLPSLNLRNPDTYFKEGIACSLLSTKGASFRYQPPNYIYDSTTRSIFLESNSKYPIQLYIALLNTKLVSYILDCLNSTVATNSDDIHRIPIVDISKGTETLLESLTEKNIECRKKINQGKLIEKDFCKNPLLTFLEVSLQDRFFTYINYENALLTLVMLNEAIINKLIFEAYDLSPEDLQQIETKMGKSVGELPVLAEAREAYLSTKLVENETVSEFIQSLAVITFDEHQVQVIKTGFESLYQNNNDLEEFCIRHQINPINVWYWFSKSKILPPARATEVALEFLADACRTILMEDDDGIIPLVGLPGELRLLDRLEQHCLQQGLTSAQFMQLEGLLGRPVNEYMEHHFFKNLSDHLNLFMYLPKTPFIWHLSSGSQQGFEAYIIIYKWNRDSLYKLKTKYLGKRAESLEYRQIELTDSNTAQAQNEKEIIRLKLQEIKDYTNKIDQLIAEGYDPKLDDGVGKNIAPMQQKGMLRCEVLNAKQLEKYLKADW